MVRLRDIDESDDLQELMNGFGCVDKGRLSILIVKDEQGRTNTWYTPSYMVLRSVCDDNDLDYDQMRQLIHETSDTVHTVMIDVVKYKAAHPELGDTSTCRNCGEPIKYTAYHGGKSRWIHDRGGVIKVVNGTALRVAECGLPPQAEPVGLDN